MYQAGGQPGHRGEELIFAMKSIISKYRNKGKSLILQTLGLSKFFDKEMIKNAIQTCYKQGADPKAWRLWYNMNQDTQIRLRTGAGMSDFTYHPAFNQRLKETS